MRPEWISSAIKIETMENTPNTRAALFQHVLRSVYWASIWTTSEVSYQNTLSVSSWG